MPMKQVLQLLAVVALFLASCAYCATDPYNALIWNRTNHEAGNGKIDRGDWFEWWYYKVVVPDTTDAFYFVYGVVNPWDSAATRPASRAYVGFGSFADKQIIEDVRPTTEFEARYDSTFVKIGDNVATDRELGGAVSGESGSARWQLSVEREWTFNGMGWAMFKSWISNIFWYPVQAGARMSGWIETRGRRIEVNGAPAYQDRNWGRSFPKWWTWIVSNSFKGSPDSVLAVGGGRPKLPGGFDLIETVTIGLRHKGREYTFRPTEDDKVRVDIKFGKWEVFGANRRGETIWISASAPSESFMDLTFMTPQGQVFHDFEALRGRIRVKLKKWNRLVAELETDEGGIEYGSFDAGVGAAGDGRTGGALNELFNGIVHLQ